MRSSPCPSTLGPKLTPWRYVNVVITFFKGQSVLEPNGLHSRSLSWFPYSLKRQSPYLPPPQKKKNKIELLALCKPRLPFAPLKNTKWKKLALFSEGQTRAVIRLDTKHKYQWQIYIWRRGDDVIELVVSKPSEISRRYCFLHSDMREFTSGIFHLPAQVLGTISCFHDDLATHKCGSPAKAGRRTVFPSFLIIFSSFFFSFYYHFSLN